MNDKVKHLIAGGLTALFFLPFGLGVSAVAVLVVAVGKEIYDLTGRGTPEWLDLVATLAGGAIVIGPCLL
jgi:hypothetical protein